MICIIVHIWIICSIISYFELKYIQKIEHEKKYEIIPFIWTNKDRFFNLVFCFLLTPVCIIIGSCICISYLDFWNKEAKW